MRDNEQVKVVEVDQGEAEKILAAVKASVEPETYEKLSAIVHGYIYVLGVLRAKSTAIQRLRKLLFGPKSEKTGQVFPEPGSKPSADGGAGPKPAAGQVDAKAQKPKRKGHGRNAYLAYPGASRTWVPHATLKPGDICPGCLKGKLYEQKHPAVVVRFTGRAPVEARVWEQQRLRCNLCGEIYTAQQPEQLGPDKYDESAAAMVAMLRYGSGTPFYRLARLQKSLGIPLPHSTQWDIVRSKQAAIEPVFEELTRQAANAELLHNDDTGMKVLSLMGKPGGEQAEAERPAPPAEPDKTEEADGSEKRKGIFTSGIVAVNGGHEIALFFTGRQHAGENLRQVLLRRAQGLGPPMQMCDGLSRNEPQGLPESLKTILGNCNAHARRRFVDVAGDFPEECLHVLQELSKVYNNDETARKLRMTDAQRLRFHQTESGPVMGRLKKWMKEQLSEKRVEPNSGLGKAIDYTLKRWLKLVLFLRVPGAPLDNNIVERSLKKLILLRKNSLFYRTVTGARLGDMYMSLIHTAELCRANVFQYLVALMRHAEQVASHPAAWMPWNYTGALAGLSSGVDPPR